jgi:type 1 fimbriae regulatory protein FimB/type 1 fimbriae regulatory protein FimE
MAQVVELQARRKASPTAVSGKVRPPTRRPNRATRTREFLSEDEVDRLLKAVSAGTRYGGRDRTLLLLMYRHGLRVGEAIALRWDQLDLKQGLLYVHRLKNGVPSTHLLAAA